MKDRISELLEKASAGQGEVPRDNLKILLFELLKTPVYIPKKNSDELNPTAINVKNTEDLFNYLTFKVEDKKILPIFSSKEYLAFWLELQKLTFPHEQKLFKDLLWVLDNETWLYLNSDQDYGKEFSPWEIELLKGGTDSIEEICADIMSESHDFDIEVEDNQDLYPQLKRDLRSIFEVFLEVEEAFLAVLKVDSETSFLPILGLKLGKISQEKQELLLDEIQSLSLRHLPPPNKIIIETDLTPKGTHYQIFQGILPFYIYHAKINKPARFSARSILNKATSIFSKEKKSNSDS